MFLQTPYGTPKEGIGTTLDDEKKSYQCHHDTNNVTEFVHPLG